MMKKKLRLILVIVGILFIGWSVALRSNAASIEVIDEFEDLSFSAIPVITNDEKSKCIITWKTNSEIKYLKVLLKLQNNKEQIPYDSSRSNSSGTFNSKRTSGNKYLNTLEIEVDNSQLGNIKIRFDYCYEMVLGGTNANIKSFTYVFVTGKWIKEQPTHIAILAGTFITFVVVVATYVIIENSHREVMNDDKDDDEDLNDE